MTDPDAPRAHFLLAGDGADLEALRETIGRLPVDAYGQVVVEVDSAAEIERWRLPAGMSIAWLPRDVEPVPAEPGLRLEQAVLAWLREWMPAEGHRAHRTPFVIWMGCASSARIDALCDQLAWRVDHLHLHEPRPRR